tara:strand:+ start:342 stop:695 length:354 start_codon:yes stop_codon:yes gene_type:complete
VHGAEDLKAPDTQRLAVYLLACHTYTTSPYFLIIVNVDVYELIAVMSSDPYGSVEYYRDHFADLIGDVSGSDDIEQNCKVIANVMVGFRMAIKESILYHDVSAESYRELMNKFQNSL